AHCVKGNNLLIGHKKSICALRFYCVLKSQRAPQLSIAFFDDLTAVIHTCLQVNMVTAHWFTRVRVFNPVHAIKSMVGASHVALRCARFSLWYSHYTIPSFLA